MARLEYADVAREETRALVDRMAHERGGVLHLYRMLLNSPPVAEGWLGFLTAIRHHCRISDDTRELAIMRIAALNNASYEADQHREIALISGLTPTQLDALEKPSPDDVFDATQRAVIALTDAMTREILVSDDIWASVRKRFDDQEIVELTATIAAYNMVSRFLVALEIASDDKPSLSC